MTSITRPLCPQWADQLAAQILDADYPRETLLLRIANVLLEVAGFPDLDKVDQGVVYLEAIPTIKRLAKAPSQSRE